MTTHALPDLNAIQAVIEAINSPDNCPMANGEQIEEYTPLSYLEHSMAVINAISDHVHSGNIELLAKANPLKVQMLLMDVAHAAEQIANLLENSDVYQ